MAFEKGNKLQRGKNLTHGQQAELRRMVELIYVHMGSIAKVAKAFSSRASDTEVASSTIYNWLDGKGGSLSRIEQAKKIIINNNIK